MILHSEHSHTTYTHTHTHEHVQVKECLSAGHSAGIVHVLLRDGKQFELGGGMVGVLRLGLPGQS